MFGVDKKTLNSVELQGTVKCNKSKNTKISSRDSSSSLKSGKDRHSNKSNGLISDDDPKFPLKDRRSGETEESDLDEEETNESICRSWCSISYLLPPLFILFSLVPGLILTITWHSASISSLEKVQIDLSKTTVDSLRNRLGIMIAEPLVATNTASKLIDLKTKIANISDIYEPKYLRAFVPLMTTTLSSVISEKNNLLTSLICATSFENDNSIVLDYRKKTNEFYVGLSNAYTNFTYINRNCSFETAIRFFSARFDLTDWEQKCSFDSSTIFLPTLRPWYKDALLSHPGLAWTYFVIQGEVLSGRLPSLTYSIAKTISFANGSISGVTVCANTFGDLQTFMQDEDNDTVTMILDEKGQILALSDSRYKFFVGKNVTDVKNAKFEEGDFGKVVQNTVLKYGGVVGNVPNHFMMLDNWGVRFSKESRYNSGLFIAAGVEVGKYREATRRQGDISMVMFMMLFVLTLIIALLFSHGVIRPIKSLVESFKETDRSIEEQDNPILVDEGQSLLKGIEKAQRLLHINQTNNNVYNNGEEGSIGSLCLFQTSELKELQAHFLVMMSNLWRSRKKKVNEMISKELFLKFVFHELRVPMNVVVLGLEDIVESKNITTEEIKRNLSIIHSEVKSVVTILNDTLTIQKLEAGKFEMDKEPFYPKHLFRAMVMKLRECQKKQRKKIQLNVSVSKIEDTKNVKNNNSILQLHKKDVNDVKNNNNDNKGNNNGKDNNDDNNNDNKGNNNGVKDNNDNNNDNKGNSNDDKCINNDKDNNDDNQDNNNDNKNSNNDDNKNNNNEDEKDKKDNINNSNGNENENGKLDEVGELEKVLNDINDCIPEKMLGDVNRIRKVLEVLVSNALKFTKSKISVGIEHKILSKNWHKLKVWVVDNGPGLSEEQRKFLFQPFTVVRLGITQSCGGSGLSLCIANSFAEMHGGYIDVSSEPFEDTKFEAEFVLKEGACDDDMDNNEKKTSNKRKGCLNGYDFEIEMIDFEKNRDLSLNFVEDTKYVKPKSIINKNSLPKSPDDLPKKCILVVDDSSANRAVVSGTISRMGFICDTARNGKEAVEKVLSNPPSLVLMDKEMPEMNGDEAIAELRKNGITIPLVGFTGSTMDADVALLKKAGADAVLFKPLKYQNLVETFRYYDLC